MACLAGVRHAGLMVIEVTRIGGDGSIRRAVVDTAGRDDAARWERLAQQAALEVPPYRRSRGSRSIRSRPTGTPPAATYCPVGPLPGNRAARSWAPTSPTREHLTGWRGGGQTGQVLASLDLASRGYRH